MNSLLITQSAAISAPLAVADIEGFSLWAQSRGFQVHKAEPQALGRYVLCAKPDEAWCMDEERYPAVEVFWSEIAVEIRPFMIPHTCAVLYESTIHTCTKRIPVWAGAMVHILIDGCHFHGDLIDLASFMLKTVKGEHEVYDAGTGGALVHTFVSQ